VSLRGFGRGWRRENVTKHVTWSLLPFGWFVPYWKEAVTTFASAYPCRRPEHMLLLLLNSFPTSAPCCSGVEWAASANDKASQLYVLQYSLCCLSLPPCSGSAQRSSPRSRCSTARARSCPRPTCGRARLPRLSASTRASGAHQPLSESYCVAERA
jgi:hypothetical protein